MCYTTWFSFFIISFFISLSPGPGSIQAMNYGLSQGLKKTSYAILGQEIALIIILITIGLSTGIILLSNKAIFFIKIIGSIWLIYTGYITWKRPIININNNINFYSLNKLKLFISGFITTITNSKIIVFMLSLMPQFILSNYSLFKQLILIILTMVIIDTIIMYLYAFAANKIQNLIYKSKVKKIQNRFFGGILILSGISIFFPFL
ncbi:LysE family translocator [Sodalis-like secondary symbiont of Drepanosiphum platanoidis]|uniref:LysE family translocator n=1 Tax=Sodalis-like secondary symbiont of Drepanosiphum platanoidis TaxID=2994493 RepID=UPI003464E839